MIEATKEIGKYALEKEGKNINDPLNILIDNPESNPKNPAYKKVLIILITKEDEKYKYKGVEIEEYASKKVNNYLYKQGSSNGPDITPTSRVTTIESTFEKTKILHWFKPYTKLGLDENTNFLVKIGDCLRSNKDQILNDLKEKYSTIDKKEKSIITLKIDNKYIGEIDVFRNILVEKSTEGFYSKYGKKSKAKNKICYVCNEIKPEIYGFVDTYKFYTVDKPGFVSGGFHQEDAWKVYPVCLNCTLLLDEGKKYINNNLNFNFYGFKYYLIPKFINNEDKHIKEVLELMEKQQDPKFRKTEINRLTQDEKEILEIIGEQKNYLNVNFMFYDAPKGPDGSVFNILLYIEDILPSRLKKLFDVKKEVDKIDIFKECLVPVSENKKKTGETPMEFNFGIVRTFFPKTKKNGTHDKYFLDIVCDKYFLDIVNKIFTNKLVDYYFLLQFIMQKIRNKFVNNYPTKISTLQGFMLLNYLNKLNILKINKKIDTSKMEPTTNVLGKAILEKEEEIKQKTDVFFKQFADFFDSDAKKAIFLEGVLTQFLLDIQYQERKAKPFRVKLKGLKLDEKEIKALLPEIQNKLEEYGKNYYKQLESIISDYFVSAGNEWKLTTDEISFYFVLGMNLSYKFKSKKEEENKNGNE